MSSEREDVTTNSTTLTHEELDQKFFLPLTVQDTFTRVYQIFVAQWSVFLVINSIAIGLIIALVMTTFLFMDATYEWEDEDDDGYGSDFGWQHAVAAVVEVCIFYCVQCIADGANIRAVAEVYAGRTPNILDCAKESGRRILSLLGADILVGVTIVVPLLLLIWYALPQPSSMALFVVLCTSFAVFCLVVVLCTYMTYPAVMVDGLGPLKSCRRSFELSSGHRGYIFFTLAVFTVLKLFVNALVTSLSPNGGGMSAYYYSYNDKTYFDVNMGGPGDGPLAVLFGILFAALGSIFQAVIFLNVGVMKEGLTSKKLSDQLGLPDVGGDNYEMIADKKDSTVV